MTLASASSKQRADDYGRFAIGFDHRDRARFHALIDEVLDSERWSEADMVGRFEGAWEAWNGPPAVAVSSWAGGALAAAQCRAPWCLGVGETNDICLGSSIDSHRLRAVRDRLRRS